MPQSGPTGHIIMKYTHGKCSRVIWGHSGQHLVHSSFYPSKWLRGTKITKSAVVKKFWWAEKKSNILSLIMVLEGHFGAIWTKLERVFLRKVHFYIYPILAQIAPKWPSRTIIDDNISFFYTPIKFFSGSQNWDLWPSSTTHWQKLTSGPEVALEEFKWPWKTSHMYNTSLYVILGHSGVF